MYRLVDTLALRYYGVLVGGSVITVSLDLFSTEVHFVHCTLVEFQELVPKYEDNLDTSSLHDSQGSVAGNLIWVSSELPRGSLMFLRTLVHEVSHFVDELMLDLGLEGTEVRAYAMDYIFGTTLSEYKRSVHANPSS